MDSVNIAVIGLGHWGPNHVRVVSQLPGCRLAGVSDLNPQSRTKTATSYPGVPVVADYKDLLDRTDVDAVIVATPTSTHSQIVRDALLAGKHVLCEKPLCTDTDQGAALVALAESENLRLMVGHIFLFNAGLMAVRGILKSGDVGEVRYLSTIRTNLGPVRSDVNAAWDLASHDISIFNWITESEPVEVKAMGAAFLQQGVEDIVDISLKYPHGILASIRCSWLDPKKVRQLTVVGSRKMVTWDDLALSNPVAVYEKSVEKEGEASTYGEFLKLSMHDGEVRLPKVEPREPLISQAREFVSAIREARTPQSNGSFALGVVRTLERVAIALNMEGA